MMVIAKLRVDSVIPFGTGTFVQLGCVCENDLMAAYATSDEDKLFTRYSPWGEMRLNQRGGWAVFHRDEQHVETPGGPRQFYAVLVPADQAVTQESCLVKVDCYSKTKFAGDGSRVELRETYDWARNTLGPKGNIIERLSWKMQVDNPPAEEAFVPGTSYWLAFYDAEKFTKDTALHAALGHSFADAALD